MKRSSRLKKQQAGWDVPCQAQTGQVTTLLSQDAATAADASDQG
jgi:hypothetical protein